MPVTLDYVTNIISGAGVAGAFIIAIMVGQFVTKNHLKDVVGAKDSEIADLKEANKELRTAASVERQRGDAAVEAAQSTYLLLAGIRKESRS